MFNIGQGYAANADTVKYIISAVRIPWEAVFIQLS